MHTIGYMCITLSHTHTHWWQQFQQVIHIFIFLDECISTCDLCSSSSTWFVLHDYNITTNVYIFIVSLCSSEGPSTVLLLLVMFESRSRAPMKHYREHDEASLHVCIRHFSEEVCFILFRVGLSELLLWWWSLWLDQGQRRRPSLGDNAWSIR